MIDAGDLPRPGKDVVLRPSTTVTPLTDASSGSLPEHLTPEQRFKAQIMRWLHPDSPDTVSVRFPDKEVRGPDETRTIPGDEQRFTFVDSPDGKMKIGLFASGNDGTLWVDVKWLDMENRKAGYVRFLRYGSVRNGHFEQHGVDHFSQSVMTHPDVLSEADITRWEQQGARVGNTYSPSQHDMRPDLATALEGGIYNDTLTQNALRYFTEQQGATRVTNQDTLSAGEDASEIPASPTKAIEQ